VKRKLLCILIGFLLMFSFFGCTGPTQIKPDEATKATQQNSILLSSQNDLVSIKDNYWYLASKNTNAVFYKNLSGSRGLEFELVTAFTFETDELVVEVQTLNSNVSHVADCWRDAQEEEEVFPFYIYQCYKGVDWKLMGELAAKQNEDGGTDIETTQELRKIQNMYLEEYQDALDQKKLPQLYRYKVGISFKLDNMNSIEHVKSITLTLRGETKQYDFDNLILDSEKEFEYENLGISTSAAALDAPIYISNDGTLDLTYLDLQSQESFTLTGLSILGEDSPSITDCYVTLTKDDGTETEIKWDGKTPTQILEGESVRIQAFCKDPKLAGVMEAVTAKYIMLQYLSADGKECTEFMQGTYRMRQGLYDLYAVSDGVNILSYYLDYYSVNPNMIGA